MPNSFISPSPKDIFEQAIDRLYSHAKPCGFTLLKNNDIKKKCGKLTARIFFFRSSKNYISHENGSGSVKTEVYCLLSTKEYDGVYRLDFGRGSAESFQLLSKNLTLNVAVVDGIWEIIKKEFVDVIIGLETNPRKQLLSMGLCPESSPMDFSYTCRLKRPLFEAFGFDDLLEAYDKNCEIFYSPKVAARRSQDRYYETLRERINFEYCETVSQNYLFELLEEAYNFLKTTERYTPKCEAEYHLCHERKSEDKARFVLSVFQLLYPGVNVWFKNESTIAGLNQKILELKNELIIR